MKNKSQRHLARGKLQAKGPVGSAQERAPSYVHLVAVSLLVAVLAVGIGLSNAGSATAGPVAQEEPTRISPVTGLAYVRAQPGERQAGVDHRPRNNLSQGPSGKSSRLATIEISRACEISSLYAAPRGPWMILEVNCESGVFTRVVHGTSGQVRELSATLPFDSAFLTWAPSGKEVYLIANLILDPRVYRVDIPSGKAEAIDVPDNVYDLALSRRGDHMIYSVSDGLGYGSTTWIADADGGNPRRVLEEPSAMVSQAQWSPRGDQVAYILMPDTNVPFTVGQLWVLDVESGSTRLIAEADAGHGFKPAWSPEGTQLAFVARTNADDLGADWENGKLISELQIADLTTGTVRALTDFGEARVESPVWSPEGEFIAFSALARGKADVWMFDVIAGHLLPLTSGADTRHPAWTAGD